MIANTQTTSCLSHMYWVKFKVFKNGEKLEVYVCS